MVVTWATLGAGTIDEKIYQRQLMKGQIADMMEGQGAGKGKKGGAGSRFSVEELKELFKLRLDTACDTHHLLCKASADKGTSDTLTMHLAPGAGGPGRWGAQAAQHLRVGQPPGVGSDDGAFAWLTLNHLLGQGCCKC